ncbi:hypothetical protein G7046_g3314 [Stylonectria norvegica]|nr:hypothetical protein G7046_g3314 [Stylonectria norvegica]
MATPNPSSDASTSKPRPPTAKSATDPVLRNALRYTVSAREYASLHKYILSRSRVLRRTTPTPASVEKALQPKKGGDDYNARAVRHALRVFAGTWLGMKGWDVVSKRLGRDKESNANAQKKPFYKSPTLRLSLSLSTILLLYRILFRFLTRLRVHLLDPQVEPFRMRNPRTAATLTSPYAPAIGASLAGLALGVYPAQKMRVTIAIYTIFRALEFAWNLCEADGLIWGSKNGRKRERPWWFGSWMLQPLACGQLLHALVFDREAFPKPYGDFIFQSSTAYLHPRPQDWPANLKWPKPYQIVDNLAEMARLSWPAYISPTLFPNKEVLPPTLTALGPLTSQAHPLITSLSCATLHPSDPSCLRTYLTFWLTSFPPMARFIFLVYSATTVLPRLSTLYHNPLTTLHRLVTSSLRMTTFLTGSISTAWASICFFQAWLPRHILATQRFFLGGFFAGLWAWVERRNGRGIFLYSARASIDSLWKVGVKRRWWKSMKGGDVWLFVLALMVTGVVYERDAQAIREGNWRKGMSWVRGEGWRDWSVEEEEIDEDKEKGE